MGQKITEGMIDKFEGDASNFFVAVRPEIGLSEKIKKNIDNAEALESNKLDRISKRLIAGEILFKQGEKDKVIYILMDGIVEIYVSGCLVAEIKDKGTFVGELSILTESPRSATVKAQTDCLFYCIDGTDLFVLAKEYPEVLSRLCKSLANKIAYTSNELSELKMAGNESHTRIISKHTDKNSPLFQNTEQIKDKIFSLEKNVDLFVEGEMTFDMYILIKGEVRVSIGNESIVRISAPGSLLGEMSSLRVKPRSATITTIVPSDFIKIEGLRLKETCQENPLFLVKLAQILANRLLATSAEYAHLIKSADL